MPDVVNFSTTLGKRGHYEINWELSICKNREKQQTKC